MRTEPPATPDDPTRHQLLEAAGAVFAETGFRDATVREICRRAGANIAAVNYHFGDKETLYAEVLRFAYQKSVEKYPPQKDVSADADAETKLRAFVLSFLLRIFDKGSKAWHGKLLSHEMIEPTTALDLLVEERIRPMFEQLRVIIAEILKCPLNDERVRPCCFSVVSQCVFYHHCQPLILRLFAGQNFDSAAVTRLADHITRFSLAAMNHLSETKISKAR